ncbi:MAG: ElyC/SanA/YdcF family protein [Planctomycetota bacterium]
MLCRWPRLRRVLICAAILSFVAALALVLIDHNVTRAAHERIHTEVSSVPERSVGVVLGTTKHLRSGKLNVYYRERVRTAAELFHAGKVRGLLVSGDNSRVEYNEPEDMRQDLIKAGVPEDCITLDYAGFRTLDSVVRAREVFGQNGFVVVTQKFHAERAVYLAQSHGIDAVGCVATDAIGIYRVRVRLREVLARAKAWLDVNVLGTRPKFLGPKEQVSLR